MSAIPDTIRFCNREATLRLRDGRLFILGKDATTWDAKRIENWTGHNIAQVKPGSILALDRETEIEKFTIYSRNREYFIRRFTVPGDMKISVFGAPGSVWFDVEGFREHDPLIESLDYDEF